MDHTREIARLKRISPPFKMTPRRKQVLWHIAYYGDLRMKLSRNWTRSYSYDPMPLPFLAGVDVSQMVNLFRRAGLVNWRLGDRHLTITPFGMEVLLNGFESLSSEQPSTQYVALSDQSP